MNPVDRRHFVLRDALVGRVLRGSAGTAYYLRELISEGGQGWVFKANWDEPGGIVVIVKVLRPDAIQADSLPRFRREAEVLRLLSQQPRPNPYIVRFFDHAVAELATPSGDAVSLPFTVLEYVPGPTLEQVLGQQRGRGLSAERVRRLARQAVYALELVHAQEVVHRDLKPSNILLATEGGAEVAKLTDFGIVKRTDSHLQRTTALAGVSLGYAPPEQYEQGNDRVTPKTDIFSLAAIIHEMLAGQMAFPFSENESPLVIVTRILNGPRPELVRVRSQLPPELAARLDLVRELDVHLGRALSSDPAYRQTSVTELWGRVEPLLRDVSTVGADAPPSMLPFASTETGSQGLSQTDPMGTTTQRSERASAPPPPEVRLNPILTPPVPGRRSPRPSDPSSDPGSWAWRVVSKPIQDNIVSTASFSPTGESIVAAGAGGLARWARGTWAGFASPLGVDPRGVRGLRITADGDLVLFGDRSLAARISPRGAHEAWTLPSRELSLRGARVEDDLVTFVGDRAAAPGSSDTIGIAVQLSGGHLAFSLDIAAITRLHAVARFEGGALVAVGDRGSLVRLDRGAADLEASICRGNLVAIEPLVGGGGVTVGGGGHALYISPRLEAHLEAVQTTRDLSALAIGSDGAAWAGAAQARLLRREADSWVRMSGEVGITPRVLAIWASAPLVRAVCDDGAILEGRAA